MDRSRPWKAFSRDTGFTPDVLGKEDDPTAIEALVRPSLLLLLLVILSIAATGEGVVVGSDM